jgi:hypothetical protein
VLGRAVADPLPVAAARASTGRTGESDLRVVTEASPLASFETAAGHFGDAVDVPADLWTAYRGDVLYLRAVERGTGRVLRSWAKARIPA